MHAALISEKTDSLLNRIESAGKLVGDTPLFKFEKLGTPPGVALYAKMEWLQLGGSVKARAAFHIIREAMREGQLTEGKILLDATSGNTGIAYASIGARVGIRIALCLPENASQERKDILQSLGVQIIYTSKLEGTDGAQIKARSLAETHPNLYFYADQYKNPNNWKAHYHTTAEEIVHAVPGITHFITGLGTTGTFMGTSRRLKEINKDIQVISLQPDSALHGLEGWKFMETAIVPTIYDPRLADAHDEVTTEESHEMLRKVYEQEGLLLSPSSAANLAGAVKFSQRLGQGTIVTVLPDNADKYGEVIKRIL